MTDEFSQLTDIVQLDPKSIERELKQDPFGFLAGLGFEPLFTRQGFPKSEVVKRRSNEMIHRKPRSRRPGIIFKDRPYEMKFEVWYHPAGIVASLPSTRHISSHDGTPLEDFKPADLTIKAVCSVPLTDDGDKLSTFTLTTGERVRVLKASARDGTSFHEFWKNVIAQQTEGKLLSHIKWHQCLTDPTFDAGYSEALLPFQDHSSLWLEVALPWDKLNVCAKATQTPFIVSNLEKQTTVRYKGEVNQAAVDLAKSLPDQTKPLILLSLKKSIENNAPSTHANTDFRQRKFNRAKRVEQLVNSVVSFLGSTQFLDVKQSKTVSSWIQEMLQPSRSSSLRWNCLPVSLPGIENFSRLDLALSVSCAPGMSSKIIDCVQGVSDSQLLDWCQGVGCARPLALSVARTMLHTQNRAYPKEDIELTSQVGRSVLSTIFNRLGPAALVWDDQLGNVWGEAVGQLFNLPGDEDLVDIQARRTQDFLSWAIEYGVDLPSTVRWVPDMDQPEKVCQASLLDPREFIQAWRENAREYAQRSPECHWDLLSPVSSYFKRQELVNISNLGSANSNLKARPSL